MAVETDESEGIDEADGEADEGLDEAVLGASARLRADQDSRTGARRGRDGSPPTSASKRTRRPAQKSITRQIQSVRPGGAARVAAR